MAIWHRKKFWILFGSGALVLAPLLFSHHWRTVFYASAVSSWELVFEKTWAGLVILGASWLGEIYREHRKKWKTEAKFEAKKVFTSLKVPSALFGVVFFIHLFAITPAKQIALAEGRATDAETKIEELKKNPKPIPIDVKTEDPQARTNLRHASNEIAQLKSELSRFNFTALDGEKRALFAALFKQASQRWTNLSVDVRVNTSMRKRMEWAKQLESIVGHEKLPLAVHRWTALFDVGYNYCMFFKTNAEPALNDFAFAFSHLVEGPIYTCSNAIGDADISFRLIGEPYFHPNGIIYFGGTNDTQSSTIAAQKAQMDLIESGAKQNPVLSSVGNPNTEKVIPPNPKAPAINYDSTGVMWHWNVNDHKWH